MIWSSTQNSSPGLRPFTGEKSLSQLGLMCTILDGRCIDLPPQIHSLPQDCQLAVTQRSMCVDLVAVLHQPAPKAAVFFILPVSHYKARHSLTRLPQSSPLLIRQAVRHVRDVQLLNDFLIMNTDTFCSDRCRTDSSIYLQNQSIID